MYLSRLNAVFQIHTGNPSHQFVDDGIHYVRCKVWDSKHSVSSSLPFINQFLFVRIFCFVLDDLRLSHQRLLRYRNRHH